MTDAPGACPERARVDALEKLHGAGGRELVFAAGIDRIKAGEVC